MVYGEVDGWMIGGERDVEAGGDSTSFGSDLGGTYPGLKQLCQWTVNQLWISC